jgi:hypothetical protein
MKHLSSSVQLVVSLLHKSLYSSTLNCQFFPKRILLSETWTKDHYYHQQQEQQQWQEFNVSYWMFASSVHFRHFCRYFPSLCSSYHKHLPSHLSHKHRSGDRPAHLWPQGPADSNSLVVAALSILTACPSHLILAACLIIAVNTSCSASINILHAELTLRLPN